jgi:hypothetical protein
MTIPNSETPTFLSRTEERAHISGFSTILNTNEIDLETSTGEL